MPSLPPDLVKIKSISWDWSLNIYNDGKGWRGRHGLYSRRDVGSDCLLLSKKSSTHCKAEGHRGSPFRLDECLHQLCGSALYLFIPDLITRLQMSSWASQTGEVQFNMRLSPAQTRETRTSDKKYFEEMVWTHVLPPSSQGGPGTVLWFSCALQLLHSKCTCILI